jgi:hypothetical protein
MWRCPKCVTHVKDEQVECPICRSPQPAQAPPEPDDAAPLLDELFPRKPIDEEPLIPALDERDLEKEPAIRKRWIFLIGFVGAIVAAFLYDPWESAPAGRGYGEHFLTNLLTGVGGGVVLGLGLVQLYWLGATALRAMFNRFHPREQGLRAAIEHAPEADDEEDPFDGEWSLDEQAAPDAIHDPTSSPPPPSPTGPNQEPTDAFRPAP